MTAVVKSEINWMTAKGWLKDAERELLFELASRLPGNAVILNIGVEFGASLACLRAGNLDATIYGLDIDCSKAVSDYSCRLIEVDSHEMVKDWPVDYKFDLVFVDGDHGEAGVIFDAGFADFLPVGCYILFQDCWDWEDTSIVHQVCPGVNAGVDKWFASHNTEFEELPSVETTRVFKRVKEHEQPRVADSSGFTADLRATGSIEPNNQVIAEKLEVSGQSKTISRRR